MFSAGSEDTQLAESVQHYRPKKRRRARKVFSGGVEKMIKIRCIDCGKEHVYKPRGGARRKRCTKCARKHLTAYQQAYGKKWRENNVEQRREYNKKWQQELKTAILGFEQMRMKI